MLNAVKFWDRLKKFGSAQNILGPVKGQGIDILKTARIVLAVKKGNFSYLATAWKGA